MGLIRSSVSAVKALLPDGRNYPAAVGASVPVGMRDVPQIQDFSYVRNAQEGYMRNELLYTVIEMRATSAAEPRLVAYKGKEKLTDHPFIELWEKPNPFMDRFEMTAGMIMFRDIGGNAYLEKVRSRAGKVVEIWQLRPDRMFVIPDAMTYIAGYQYRWGAETFYMPTEDVVHFKNRHPMNDWYGLPPMAPAAARVDLDNWMRDFTRAFFLNAGVPAGMLNVKHSLEQQERELIRARFRGEYGGQAGWHSLLVIDGGEAKYEPMGMPIGARGLAMPELDEINEARICMVYGVPLSLAGARLGMSSSSYGNRRQDETVLWELTLVPLYVEMAAALTRAFKDEYTGSESFDRLAFDMSDVDALQGDQTDLHKRWREDLLAGIISQEEARQLAGYPADVNDSDTFFVPAGHLTRTTNQSADSTQDVQQNETGITDVGDRGQDVTGAGSAAAGAAAGASQAKTQSLTRTRRIPTSPVSGGAGPSPVLVGSNGHSYDDVPGR